MSDQAKIARAKDPDADCVVSGRVWNALVDRVEQLELKVSPPLLLSRGANGSTLSLNPSDTLKYAAITALPNTNAASLFYTANPCRLDGHDASTNTVNLCPVSPFSPTRASSLMLDLAPGDVVAYIPLEPKTLYSPQLSATDPHGGTNRVDGLMMPVAPASGIVVVVGVTQTGGSAGGGGAYCSYTYNSGFGGKTFSGLSPVYSPARMAPLPTTAATQALASISGNSLTLWIVNETWGSPYVCTTTG